MRAKAIDKSPGARYDKGHNEAHSSSGPGHRPLKAETAGSNPACATRASTPDVSSLLTSGLRRFISSGILPKCSNRVATRSFTCSAGRCRCQETSFEPERVREQRANLKMPLGTCTKVPKLICKFTELPCFHCPAYVLTPEDLAALQAYERQILERIEIGKQATNLYWIEVNQKNLYFRRSLGYNSSRIPWVRRRSRMGTTPSTQPAGPLFENAASTSVLPLWFIKGRVKP